MGGQYRKMRKDEGLKPSAINRHIVLLTHMFTKAIEWGIVEQNPVKKVKPYKENNQGGEKIKDKRTVFFNCIKEIRNKGN